MTRRLLATTMMLGLIVTAMGFSGIYAVFTDQATTGATSGDSAALPGTADIRIARALSQVDCPAGDFAENLVGDLETFSDIVPGDNVTNHWFCVRNVGAAAVDLAFGGIDVSSTEVGCTGDEAANGDLTCGTGAGELESVIRMNVGEYDCASGAGPGTTTGASLLAGPSALTNVGAVAAGETVCLHVLTWYPQTGFAITVAQAQVAQSDAISWRFAFDATET